MGALYLLALAAVATCAVYGLKALGEWGDRYTRRQLDRYHRQEET